MAFLRLDLQFFSGEKTEKATPKKREESRKKGQVAKSQDVNTAVVLLAVFFFLLIAGGSLKDTIFGIFKHTFQEYMTVELTESNIHSMFIDLLAEIVLVLAPIMGVAMVGGIVANFAQFGFLFTTEALQLKLDKLNPIQGAKNIFSMRALVELMKSILKIAVVGGVAFSVLWNKKEEVLTLTNQSVGSAVTTLASLTVQLGLTASAALLFLSILDYMYQKFDFEKKIRMSKQDIKDEFKNIEGNPEIKGKIKQKQREMAMRRMMQDIPTADVVITNPTHFAVVLKYDETKNDAPYVVAKGVDFLAQKIKLIASEHQIISVENRPLARALYSQTEVGDAIPEEFFKAVAEILAFVYKTKQNI